MFDYLQSTLFQKNAQWQMTEQSCTTCHTIHGIRSIHRHRDQCRQMIDSAYVLPNRRPIAPCCPRTLARTIHLPRTQTRVRHGRRSFNSVARAFTFFLLLIYHHFRRILTDIYFFNHSLARSLARVFISSITRGGSRHPGVVQGSR